MPCGRLAGSGIVLRVGDKAPSPHTFQREVAFGGEVSCEMIDMPCGRLAGSGIVPARVGDKAPSQHTLQREVTFGGEASCEMVDL